MTQKIQIDGVIHEFPDDFSQDEITNALAQTSQPPSMLESAGQGVGKFARAALQGASWLPYALADAGTQAVNLGTQGINKLAGTDIPQLQYPSAQRDETLNRFFPQDKTLADKIGSGAVQMASTIPSTAALGKAIPELGVLAENIPQQVAGAVGGGAAMGAAQQYAPDNPAIQLAAGLGGTALGIKGLNSLGATAEAAATRAAIPSKEQLGVNAQIAYKAAEDAGAVIKPSALQRLQANIQAKLATKGYHPGLQPGIKTVVDELGRISNENISTEGMQVLKRLAGGAYAPGNKSQNKMVSTITGQIDDFMSTLGADDVLQGDAKTAAAKWKEGDKAYHQMSKTQMIDDAIKKARDQTSSTGSGGNIQNKLKQVFTSIIDNPSKARGFTADERAAMQQIIDGTTMEKTLRLLGKISPTGSGLGLIAQIAGASAFGPGFVATGAVGLAAKTAAERMTISKVKAFNELIRSGGKIAPKPQTAPAISYLPSAAQQLIQSTQRGVAQPGLLPPFGLPSAANDSLGKARRGLP